MNEAKQHVAPRKKRGLFTVEQYLVLKYRERGFTQNETARALATTRANVSMIESRAKRKLRAARETVRAYHSMLTSTSVVVEKGTSLQQLPLRILNEGDRSGVHIRSNVVQIIKLVKMLEPKSLSAGKTTRKLKFVFNSRGKLFLAGKPRKRPGTLAMSNRSAKSTT